MSVLKGKKILIGITGGIAAYKTLSLIRLLVAEEAEVQVIMTESAKEFITPLSVQVLTKNRVRDSLFDTDAELSMGHIELSRWPDVILICPASANVIGKLAHGLADDLLSTVILATKVKVLIAPAMNVNMYTNKLVQNNINILENSGICFLGPAEGDQACGDVGAGRLLEPEQLYQMLFKYLTCKHGKLLSHDCIPNKIPIMKGATVVNIFNLDKEFEITIEPYRKYFEGKKVLLTAGPTRESIDPVRYISNHSSGRMGLLLGLVAKQLGANVTVVLGPVTLKNEDDSLRLIIVETAKQMHAAVMESLEDVDLFIGCAAVSDFAVKDVSRTKIKKKDDNNEYDLVLVKNPDILKDVSNLAEDRRPKIVVGFAAETDNVLENAHEKIKRKQCDLICLNDVSKGYQGFNSLYNHIFVISKDDVTDLGHTSKEKTAQAIFLEIAKAFEKKANEKV